MDTIFIRDLNYSFRSVSILGLPRVRPEMLADLQQVHEFLKIPKLHETLETVFFSVRLGPNRLLFTVKNTVRKEDFVNVVYFFCLQVAFHRGIEDLGFEDHTTKNAFTSFLCKSNIYESEQEPQLYSSSSSSSSVQGYIDHELARLVLDVHDRKDELQPKRNIHHDIHIVHTNIQQMEDIVVLHATEIVRTMTHDAMSTRGLCETIKHSMQQLVFSIFNLFHLAVAIRWDWAEIPLVAIQPLANTGNIQQELASNIWKLKNLLYAIRSSVNLYYALIKEQPHFEFPAGLHEWNLAQRRNRDWQLLFDRLHEISLDMFENLCETNLLASTVAQYLTQL